MLRKSSAAILTVSLLSLTACAGVDRPPVSPQSTPTKSVYLSDLVLVCTEGKGNPHTAGLKDRATSPHPTALLVKPDKYWLDGTINSRGVANSAYPPDKIVGADADVAKAQLVACSERVAAKSLIKMCTIRISGKAVSIPLHGALYRVHLHDTRTGHKLKEQMIKTFNSSCPGPEAVPADSTPKRLYSAVPPTEYVKFIDQPL